MRRKHRAREWRPGRFPKPILEKLALQSARLAGRKYQRAVWAGQVPKRTDQDLQAQVKHYSDARMDLQARVEEVRAVLCRMGVRTVLFVPYFNFASHMHRVVREHDGRTKVYLARLALAKWAAEGLEDRVLRAILEKVFLVTLAPEPDEGAKAD